MQLVDSHCHIHFDKLAEDLAGVLERAAEAGVNKMISVGCSLSDSEKACLLAARHDNVWASVGAHPHDGADFLQDKNAQSKLLELSKRPKVVAIGEIGLDYFHEHTDRQIQKEILHAQLETGTKTGLPFIFHVRNAWEDFWEIFDGYSDIHGVVHSFSDSPDHLQEVLDRGLFVGLNGIMTFTKVEAQLEAAKKVPLDKLILETDAPFLAPVPYRGQTCEPKHIKDIAEFLANLRGEPLEELAQATTANVEGLFAI